MWLSIEVELLHTTNLLLQKSQQKIMSKKKARVFAPARSFVNQRMNNRIQPLIHF
jgi:hypothetical protein